MQFAAFLKFRTTHRFLEQILSKNLFYLLPILNPTFLHLTILITFWKPTRKTLSQLPQNTLQPFLNCQPAIKVSEVMFVFQGLTDVPWKKKLRIKSFHLLRRTKIKITRKPSRWLHQGNSLFMDGTWLIRK